MEGLALQKNQVVLPNGGGWVVAIIIYDTPYFSDEQDAIHDRENLWQVHADDDTIPGQVAKPKFQAELVGTLVLFRSVAYTYESEPNYILWSQSDCMSISYVSY